MKEILVVGGGFAGIGAALNAADETIQHQGDIHITMVSRDEYMTIRPRLYEKNPETLRVPLRPILDPVGISFIEGTVVDINAENQKIAIQNGGSQPFSKSYDRLILAAGSDHDPVSSWPL